MELLPKDIRNIVYRYILDSKYQIVIRNYNSVFLNGETYWNEHRQCLADHTSMVAIANWRPLGNKYYDPTQGGYSIRSIYTYGVVEKLPPKY